VTGVAIFNKLRDIPLGVQSILMNLLRRMAFLLMVTALFSPPVGVPGAEVTGPNPTAPTNQAAPGAPANQASIPAVELAKALAWPAAAVVIAILLYRPLNIFVRAIGSRITKLSLFKVELELLAAAISTPLLDEIRSATTAAQLVESKSTMLKQMQSGTPADYALVALGNGEQWLTSRLYIALIMMQRMRGVKVFVFLERTANTEQRLVAIAPIGQLRWALAQRYPWLEVAWVRANTAALMGLMVPPVQDGPKPVPVQAAPEPVAPVHAAPQPQPFSWPPVQTAPEPMAPVQAAPQPQPLSCNLPDPGAQRIFSGEITSDAGGLDPYYASQIIQHFITSLQQLTEPLNPQQEPGEWVPLKDQTTGNTVAYERANWVTRSLLETWLQREAFFLSVNELRDLPRAKQTRAVLRRVGDFVAVTQGEEFVRLVNRRTLLEDIAAALGEEHENDHA
jgi:hypothetical protein